MPRVVVLDIDGLRPDVLDRALAEGRAPGLARILTPGRTLPVEAVSTAPSITFCAQTAMFTGVAPRESNVVGNQFFDRFGSWSEGQPHFYAFDVGDLLAVEDAPRIFTKPDGLLGTLIPASVSTLYEHAARNGLTSTVVYNMVGRGATEWITPSLIDIARFAKGGGLFGIEPARFDDEMTTRALQHLHSGSRPDVLTLYFLGLDHVSHHEGPAEQLPYLEHTLDADVRQIMAALESHDMLTDTIFVVASDHGQIAVKDDRRHSLRLSFPFDNELAHVFHALGLDVHDYPGEAPACDAVVASNGGLAQVYLQHRQGNWATPPRFEADVLPVARAFWQAHLTGAYSQELQGSLAMILARDVERDGWSAPYQAVTIDGQLVSVEAYLAATPGLETRSAPWRLQRLASPYAGDLILVANYADGFYFSVPMKGVHGGLASADSRAVLSFSQPFGDAQAAETTLAKLKAAIADRCQRDARSPDVSDLTGALLALLPR